MLYPLLLLLLTQVTVTSTWINVTSTDVSKILDPITSWAWSYFNVIIAFAGAIVIIWFVKFLTNKFVSK